MNNNGGNSDEQEIFFLVAILEGKNADDINCNRANYKKTYGIQGSIAYNFEDFIIDSARKKLVYKREGIYDLTCTSDTQADTWRKINDYLEKHNTEPKKYNDQCPVIVILQGEEERVTKAIKGICKELPLVDTTTYLTTNLKPIEQLH
ncbi:MAG: hypothetical protein ABIG84_01290 [archaeon]